jgi:hypothetical protein
MKTLNDFINLKGNREDSFKYAFGFKGGKKSCYTKGCEIFTNMSLNLNGVDISSALILDKIHNREI